VAVPLKSYPIAYGDGSTSALNQLRCHAMFSAGVFGHYTGGVNWDLETWRMPPNPGVRIWISTKCNWGNHDPPKAGTPSPPGTPPGTTATQPTSTQPQPPQPSVSLGRGPVAPSGYRYAITLARFPANSSVSISCRDSVDPGGFYSFSLKTDGAGNASTASYCYSADGPDHWVVADGHESNHVQW
jgi:hypothetical protein